MKTSLSHLPISKIERINSIVKIIIQEIDPEKIILFGSHASKKWVKDRYVDKDELLYDYNSDYDMCVITKADIILTDYDIEDMLVQKDSKRGKDIRIITHDITYINKQLLNGQYFFCLEIFQKGILLFDSGNTPLASPKKINPGEIREKAEKDFNKWFKSAKKFYKIAQYAFEDSVEHDENLREAIFILHQAAERAFNTIIVVFMGYKPKTHNLNKLLRTSGCFSQKIDLIFPRDTDNEKKLFDLLVKGYVDARYDDNYVISKANLENLITRVGNLLSIAEGVCRNKIESIGKQPNENR